MLLTKEVKMKWNPVNKKWYGNKGYIFTKYKDEFEVRIEDLSDGSGVFVNIECDECGELITNIMWKDYLKRVKEDGKYYCKKCAMKLYGGESARKTKLKKSISFYQWCYDNLSKELADWILSRWDYELNKCSPKDVSYGSNGINSNGYWFKCLNHPEHGSELKNIKSFISGKQGSITCDKCNKIAITHPHLIKYFANQDDSLKYSTGYDIKKIPMKCPDCGHEKEMLIANLIRSGFGCPKCSDGVSYPNKFMFNILKQIQNLNIIEYFETEKTFDWLIYEFKNKIRKGKLDFYFEINGRSYGVEMDGGWHRKDNGLSGQTKEESQYIDDEKDRLCEEYDVEVIRIDCIKSELEWIKNNILNSELSLLLNLNKNNIHWLKCHEYACKNLVKLVCTLWNNGIRNISEIAKESKFGRLAIRGYLKQGTELGWCDYDANEEKINNYSSVSERFSVKVICLTTGEIFNSQTQAGIKYNIPSSGIYACCKGKQKSSGILLDGTKLIWMYYDKYLEINK